MVAASYCDATVVGTTTCAGAISGFAVDFNIDLQGLTTAELQGPTGYSGIYEFWNSDLDRDGGADWPWDFGTSSDYPRLYTPAERAGVVPARFDYDDDNDGLIEVRTLDQLNAMRWDLDGDGGPASSTPGRLGAYSLAFAGGDTATGSGRMGCPATGCVGYELRADLDFDTSGDRRVDANDDYPDWEPIGTNYTSIFEGNGHTVTRMRIRTSDNYGGLFDVVLGGEIRNVGLVDPDIDIRELYIGGLTGRIRGTIRGSYVEGGTISPGGGGAFVGGLVGNLDPGGVIEASYSTAAVNCDDGAN